MKKIALYLLLVLIPLACVTPPAGQDTQARRELDALMEHWLTALRERNGGKQVAVAAPWGTSCESR